MVMKWQPDADAAVRKVPFFVRKRVRTRVEADVRAAGRTGVTLADVRATQARYLASQASEIRGYQLETCFGPSGCPNRTHHQTDALMASLERTLAEADLLTHLKTHVDGPLKFHHEFRVALADCPNACSQPQIRDIGIIAASLPEIADAECSICNACADTCAETAIRVDAAAGPVLDGHRCLACGQCIRVCPTGSLSPGPIGFRVLLGGKLGRRPRLAMEMPGIYSADTVVSIVGDCLRRYKSRSTVGQRFATLVTETDVTELARTFPPIANSRP